MMDRLQGAISACRALVKAGPVGVVTVAGKPRYSTSPKATGVAAHFQMGTTSSGKAIHSFADHPAHAKFSPKDHMDAYRQHAAHVSGMSEHDTHPDLIQHHRQAMQTHWKAASTDVKKAYHRSVHHVGKTRSGKKVHLTHGGADHPDYRRYSREDHQDAARVHHNRVMRLFGMIARQAKRKQPSKGLRRLAHLHAQNAHAHHRKSVGGRHGH